MTCNDLDIKGLLAAYQGRTLSPADADRITQHLSACEDCRTEISLLHLLSEEPVPDPGNAFWSALPGKIFREVQARQQKTLLQRMLFGREWLHIPRWTGAAVAVLLIAAVLVLLDRPVPLEIAFNAPPENGTSYGDILSAETVDMDDLTDIEIDSVDLWATEELALLQDEIIDLLRTSTDISLYDRLVELDTQELEQLMSMLDTQDEEG